MCDLAAGVLMELDDESWNLPDREAKARLWRKPEKRQPGVQDDERPIRLQAHDHRDAVGIVRAGKQLERAAISYARRLTERSDG